MAVTGTEVTLALGVGTEVTLALSGVNATGEGPQSDPVTGTA